MDQTLVACLSDPSPSAWTVSEHLNRPSFQAAWDMTADIKAASIPNAKPQTLNPKWFSLNPETQNLRRPTGEPQGGPISDV